MGLQFCMHDLSVIDAPRAPCYNDSAWTPSQKRPNPHNGLSPSAPAGAIVVRLPSG